MSQMKIDNEHPHDDIASGGLQGRQWLDLRRRLFYVARQHAERESAALSQLPDRRTVSLSFSTEETADQFPISCQMSCESMQEGPPEERGHRSNANGILSLMERMGYVRLGAIVELRQVRQQPARYRTVNWKITTLKE